MEINILKKFLKKLNKPESFGSKIKIGPVRKSNPVFMIFTYSELQTEDVEVEGSSITMIKPEDFLKDNLLVAVLSFIDSNITVQSGNYDKITGELRVALDEEYLDDYEDELPWLVKYVLGTAIDDDSLNPGIVDIYVESPVEKLKITSLLVLYIDELGMTHPVDLPRLEILFGTTSDTQIFIEMNRLFREYEKKKK